MLTFDIRGIFIKCIEREVIPSGTIGAKIKFVFDDEWQSFNKTVTFDYEDQNRNIKHADLAFSESEILIPPSVVASPGRFRLGIYGANGGSIATPTLYTTWFETPTGAVPSGITPEPPSTLVNQIYDIASSAENKAQSAVETSQRAVDIASKTGEQAAAAASSAAAASQSASNSAASASAALSNANAAASSAAGAEAARQQAQATADSIIVSNLNLLDNGCFANPVDQRQGRVVKPNTTYYSDNTLATAAGTTSAYVTAYRYATGTANGVNYASFKLEDTDTAPTYYAAPENVVRGYTGGGYGIDRWFETSTVTINSNSITITDSVFQRLDNPEKFNGLLLTFTVLTSDGNLYSGSAVFDYSADVSFYNANGVQLLFNKYWGGFQIIGALQLNAVKLELGGTQTLAHQENGVWVLNEIPDYGEQLAKCQRQFQLYSSADKRPEKAVDCRPVMRADPSQGTIVIGGTTYYYNTAEL